MNTKPEPCVMLWQGTGHPRVWFHATKPHIVDTLVINSFRGRLPPDLWMSWTSGARDKRAISPLLYHPDRPSQLWCLSDVSAEQIIEADAIRRNAARLGVDVLWAGVFEGVLERLTEAEAETLSIRHPPISRAVAAAARRLGITTLRSFHRLQQGHATELEVALLPEFRVPVARRLRELLQKSRARE